MQQAPEKGFAKRAADKPLAFASNKLPDIFVGSGDSTAELVQYGDLEGQLIDLAPDVNEESMPNFYRMPQEMPDLLPVVTTAEVCCLREQGLHVLLLPLNGICSERALPCVQRARRRTWRRRWRNCPMTRCQRMPVPGCREHIMCC